MYLSDARGYITSLSDLGASRHITCKDRVLTSPAFIDLLPFSTPLSHYRILSKQSERRHLPPNRSEVDAPTSVRDVGGNEILAKLPTCTPAFTEELQYTFLLCSLLSLYALEVNEEKERFPDSTESGGGFCGMRMCRTSAMDVGNADWLLKVRHSNVKMLIGC